MAEVTQNNENEDYNGRIRKHRFRTRVIFAAVALVIVVVTVSVIVSRYRSGYGHYVTLNSVLRQESESASYTPFAGGYLRYSRDGAAMVSYSGEQYWNQTYQMDNPVIDICGNYAVIANVKGTDYYLFDKSGFITSINTALPIACARVSGQGLVCVALVDAGATYISMYDKSGGKIYSIKSTIDGDGVPVSLDVSPNGEMLMVSYSTLNNQEISTGIVFYSFNAVGQNESERIVAGFDTYGSTLVSRVMFLSESNAVAVGENVVSFFRIKEYPKLITDVSVSGTIKQVFTSEAYVGLIVEAEEQAERIQIFDLNGNRKYEAPTEAGYNRYELCEDGFVMYGENEACLVSMSGKVLYRGEISDGASRMYSLSGNDEYLLVSRNMIERIKMKRGD